MDCISGRLVILSFDVGKAGLPPSYMEMETNLDEFTIDLDKSWNGKR